MAENRTMKTSDSSRQRAHAERMLQRAQKRQTQAAKLVEKWQRKLADLDRADVSQVQPRLWSEEAGTAIPSTSPQADSVVD
jgi:anti-sigma-K factor RskA